jgi:antitoxin component YwqK of YwqJK toxin-antitoxin module
VAAVKNINIVMVRMLILKISLITVCFFFFLGCSKSVNPDEVISKDGLVYNKANQQLYSGYVRAFYPEGKLQSVKEYQNGLQQGYYMRFYPNGQMSLKMIYTHGEPLNGYKMYYDNGAIKTIRTDSAEYEFIYRYYKEGPLYMIQHLKNNLLDGTSIQYYKDGSLYVSSNYSNDRKNGHFVTFHSNHQKNAECTFINDTLEGSLKEWSEKGLLLSEEYYNRGKHCGIWKYYYSSGKIRAQITFKPDGTVKGKIEYAEDGSIIDKFSSE